MHPVITISVAFTRRWAVDRWLQNLEGVTHDPALTNLVLVVDIDEPYIYHQFRRLAERKNYRSFHFRLNEKHHPNEVRLAMRRIRIAEVKNQSKDLVNKTDGEYVIGFEDDTVFERLANFDRLLQPLIDDEQIGFVQGVQMGRWGVRMIGAWELDDASQPSHAETLLPPPPEQLLTGKAEFNSYTIDGISYGYITAGGWYGYATRRNLYLNCEYYSSSAQPWGPDVNYGLWLKQQDYRCLIDWETVFGHNDHNIVGYPEAHPLSRVFYNKDMQTGRWERKDVDQAS